MNHRSTWILGLALAAGAALGTAQNARATPYESGRAVDEVVGSYTEHVPIVVPPFHGITPTLSLDYDSARGAASVLGVGWSLGGLSVIEAVEGAGTAEGAGYALDGQLLIPCYDQDDRTSAGPRSPGCTGSSTTPSGARLFSTLAESYLRIQLAAGEFTVWRTDGTRTTYRRANYPDVYASGKYLIDQVTDTDGNAVTYHWTASAPGVTFNTLHSITYGGATIRLYYAPLATLVPPAVTETYGEQEALAVIDHRLTTIDVCIDSTATPCSANDAVDYRRARAYRLSYRTSHTTSRALLTAVELVGKNAVLKGSGLDYGRVISGDAAPATTFGWNDAALTPTTKTIGAISGWGSDWIRAMVDVDGDGRGDFCRDQAGGPGGKNLLCSRSTGWGKVDAWVGSINDFGGDHDGAWVDWNGDARTDYCRMVCEDDGGGSCETWEHKNYRLRCAISDGTNLIDQQIGADLPAGQAGAIGTRWFADWNGDGRVDFCRAFDDLADQSIGHLKLKCALSTPAGYTDVKVVSFGTGFTTLAAELGAPSSRAMVDWNGDGRADLCRVIDDGSGIAELRCVLGKAYVFDRTWLSWVSGQDVSMGTFYDAGEPDARMWVDVNGDGKSDYCRQSSTSMAISCALSTAPGLLDVVWSPNSPEFADSRRWGDLNGDGKPELCGASNSSSSTVCRISTGRASTTALATPVRGFYEKHWMVDWNGDGRVEFCMNTGSNGGSGSELTCMLVAGDPASDRVTSVGNGFGAVTTIGYTPSREAPQSGPIFPVVADVTTSGGLEGPATRSYTYAGGRYDAFTRRFLGFATVRATDPCAGQETAPYQCPYTVTSYRLDPRWPTRPAMIERYGGYPAQLYSRLEYGYADTTLRPYRSDLRTESKTVYEGSRFAKSVRIWNRDRFGNVESLWDLGKLDDETATTSFPDDLRVLSYGYLPNFDSYIVDRPQYVRGTTSFAHTPSTEVRYVYDGASSYDAGPPTAGHVTQTLSWLDTDDSWVGSATQFDAYGNVVGDRDGLGNWTTYAIDDRFHQYVIETAHPLAGTPATQQVTRTSLAEWDVQCGVRTRETQVNDNTVTLVAFDNLCRKIRTDLPGGGWERIWYDQTEYGVPGRYTEVRGPGPDNWPGGDLWTRTYVDPLGRTTKVLRRGPDGNGSMSPKNIVDVEYTYDQRSRIVTRTRPRYANEPAYAYTFGYDTRDREVSRSLPAGGSVPSESVQTSYELLQVTSADSLGHRETETFDVRGQRLASWTVVGNGPAGDLAYYRYDPRGHLAQTQQLVNNNSAWVTWTSTHDSLGREIASTDPDAGSRTYAYDAAGNLVDQTDGNGARTHWTYDALGRRTSKVSNYCTGSRCRFVVPTMSTWTYDEPRAGFANAGRLTSSSDASGFATYDHDAIGNLVGGGRTVDGSTPHQFTKRYDLGGRLLGTTYPDGSSVGTADEELEYDEAGRLSYLPGFAHNVTYDAAGQLTGYDTPADTQTRFRTDNPRGALMGYTTTGHGLAGPRAVLGGFATSNTNSADQNYQTFTIAPALTVGQTITVSTCSHDVEGAAGTGDTFLQLLWKGASQPSAWRVARNDSVGGVCGVLSTITYTVPPGGEGVYSVHAGCAGSSTCNGTVAARLESWAPNLALHQPVSMSSVFDPNCGPSASATDGVTNGTWCTATSMAHSQYEAQPWLTVDLGTAQPIDHVNVWNRADPLCDAACLARLSNFDVRVWIDGSGWSDIGHVAGPAGFPSRIAADGVTSRYVSLRLRGTDYLNVPELEVVGVPATPPYLWTVPLLHDVKLWRDADGRITQITSNRPNESWSYGYSPNGLHQLTSATNPHDATMSRTFSYDDSGNMTSGPLGTMTYGVGANRTVLPHAVTGTPGVTYTYDGNGQQLSAGPGRTYTWDGDGHLLSGGGVTYTYDADGYRLKQRTGAVETIYLSDDYEITNGVHTKYVSLGGRVIAKQDGGGLPTWLYTDHLGSVAFALDASAVEVWSASYAPYGERVGGGGDGPGYTGQRTDAAGLLYLHARFASPALGRFLSPDPTTPSRRGIGLNRYAYAQNDPINRGDIDGLGLFEDATGLAGNLGGHVAKDLRKLNLADGLDGTADLLRDVTHGWLDIGHPSSTMGGFNLGVGNSLALLPSTVNSAVRGDWQAFGKSIGSEVVISTVIATTIVVSVTTYGYGTVAVAAVAASSPLVMTFALTAINTGDVNLALRNTISGIIPGGLLLSGSANKEMFPGLKHELDDPALPLVENAYEKRVLSSIGAVGGVVVGALMSANSMVAVASRDRAIGLAPSSRLSSASGGLFGYGFRQSQPTP